MPNPIKIDAEAVIKRIKKVLKVSTNIELAELFEVSNKTISSWQSRNSIPIEFLLQASEASGRKIDFFLFGEEEKRLRDPQLSEILSDQNFKNYKILGRSLLINVLGEYAHETLVFMDEQELITEGDSLGVSITLSLNEIRRERKALVDTGKMNEEDFAEYASKLHQPALHYFSNAIKLRSRQKEKGPQ